jgi:hypothetical protein
MRGLALTVGGRVLDEHLAFQMSRREQEFHTSPTLNEGRIVDVKRLVSQLLLICTIQTSVRAKSRVSEILRDRTENRDLGLQVRLLRDQLMHPAMRHECVG